MLIDLSERKKHRWEGETSVSWLPYMTPGDQTGILGICPEGGLNLQPCGAEDNDPINWATWTRVIFNAIVTDQKLVHIQCYPHISTTIYTHTIENDGSHTLSDWIITKRFH